MGEFDPSVKPPVGCEDCGESWAVRVVHQMTPEAATTTALCESCQMKRRYTSLEDIDDAIDAWHAGDSRKPLSEYLGMTAACYRCFVLDPSTWFNSIWHPESFSE